MYNPASVVRAHAFSILYIIKPDKYSHKRGAYILNETLQKQFKHAYILMLQTFFFFKYGNFNSHYFQSGILTGSLEEI